MSLVTGYLPPDLFYSSGADLNRFGSFDEMYVKHCKKDYHATYILGLYYEFGLAPCCRCLKDAGEMYSHVVTFCEDSYLQTKATMGLKRVLSALNNK
jgi:hypothetical protein